MREFIVGIVFFVLVGLLLGVTVWVDDPTAFAGGARHRMTVRFTDVGGLEPGNPVWVYGTEAGRVGDITPDGAGGVRVSLDLDYDPGMKTDCLVRLKPRSALGGMVVALTPGTGSTGVGPGTILEGKRTPGAFEGLGELVDEIREPLTKAIESMEKISTDLSAHSERIASNLDAFSENARVLTDGVRAGEGTLGKLFTDDTLHRDLEEAVAGLKKFADAANGGGGPLDVLLHDQELASNIREAGRRAKSITVKLDEGQGTLGKLLNDDQLYNHLTAASRDVRDFTADLKSGRGLLGKLVYDETLAKRMDRVSRDLAQVTGKLRKGEGTLGKLIQNEELYAQLVDSMKALTGGAEDARENAPILTFAGFLFSGF